MSFQRAMSSGFSLCCRATSAWLFRPARTSRTIWALNCGVKDRRRRFGMGGRSWEASIDYVRTDSASLRFFRQHIASLLSPRTDSASLRLVAEATAVRDGPALVRSRCSAGWVRETLRVATRETAGRGGETRTGLPHHRPRSPLPGDAPDGPCRLEPTPAGVDRVGSGRHSWG